MKDCKQVPNVLIVNDVLDFSKIEAGLITFGKIQFNLYNEINEVIKTLRDKAVQKKLDLSFVVAPDVPLQLIGDPLRLKQVLINLCTNAIQFTAGGYVHIRVKFVDMNESTIRLHFEIQATGIGISSDNQSKLFKSFVQFDTSATQKIGGTGLGLAISNKLVQMMNGGIGIISEEGKGAIFHFDCDFSVSTQSHKDDESYDVVESVLQDKKLKILLAEDNLINQKVAILNLEKMGHLVTVVSNGFLAVEKYISELPDVIFMDVQMPGMDGIEATAKIREWEHQNNVQNRVPIVAMTANTMKSEKDLFIASGMDDYLSKPFNSDELIKLIGRVCKQLERKNI